jgi:hypothetical protein
MGTILIDNCALKIGRWIIREEDGNLVFRNTLLENSRVAISQGIYRDWNDINTDMPQYICTINPNMLYCAQLKIGRWLIREELNGYLVFRDMLTTQRDSRFAINPETYYNVSNNTTRSSIPPYNYIPTPNTISIDTGIIIGRWIIREENNVLVFRNIRTDGSRDVRVAIPPDIYHDV